MLKTELLKPFQMNKKVVNFKTIKMPILTLKTLHFFVINI